MMVTQMRRATSHVPLAIHLAGIGLLVFSTTVTADQAAAGTACHRQQRSVPRTVIIAVNEAPVYLQPAVSPQPLTMIAGGISVDVNQIEADWFLVRFSDRRWGTRVGYVNCAHLRVPTTDVATEATPRITAPTSARPTRAAAPPRRLPSERPGKAEHFTGYVEWVRPGYLVVDGQRITWNQGTKARLDNLSEIQLGSEIDVRGTRRSDGSVLATTLAVKRNGLAMYEQDIKNLTDKAEREWVSKGSMFTRSDGSGLIGPIVGSGPDFDRVTRIVNRLLPPTVSPNSIRVHVVQTDQWNASAMANGAIWVNTGLLRDVRDDDELAAVIGHEIGHFTHEHTRRQMKTQMWVQLAAAGAQAALTQVNNAAGQQALALAAQLGLTAWQNGYSRNLEDQADRVGLRYAYEAGFNVSKAPGMWRRVLVREGQMDRVSNFFLGDHSRPSERIRNIERELYFNYSH
jgi:Zn-dependent protease with chaperone function